MLLLQVRYCQVSRLLGFEQFFVYLNKKLMLTKVNWFQ